MTQLLMDEADNQARSGEPEVARGLLVQAERAAPGAEERADVALAVQRLGAKFSVPRDEIVAQLEAALAAVTGVSLTKQAQLTAALARELQHSVAKDRHRAGPLSEEALTLGRQSGHDETIAACLLARHDALWGPGTGTERAELGREIAAVGAKLGDVDRQAEGLILEANGLLESGDARFRSVLVAVVRCAHIQERTPRSIHDPNAPRRAGPDRRRPRSRRGAHRRSGAHRRADSRTGHRQRAHVPARGARVGPARPR